MPRIQGDRRGLNPRQLEPQSSTQCEVSRGYADSGGQAGSARLAAKETSRTGSGNSDIAIGVRVVITGGMAHGVHGVVLERWPRDINGRIAQWVVGSSDLVRKRVVREDYILVLSADEVSR